MHTGGGIGVPLDPTGNFAGVGGTFGWWGYASQGGSVVLASTGISSGGLNGGLGITVGQASGLKFYIEARYHYSPQGARVSTQILPVTMGIRW
jgi:hypothetical protein